MTKKMLPWEGTNQYTEKTWKQQLKSLKEIGGGQGLRKKTKSLDCVLNSDLIMPLFIAVKSQFSA